MDWRVYSAQDCSRKRMSTISSWRHLFRFLQAPFCVWWSDITVYPVDVTPSQEDVGGRSKEWEKNRRRKEVYKQKRVTRISFGMDILLACKCLYFPVQGLWSPAYLRHSSIWMCHAYLYWGLKCMPQPRKTCGRIIVCLPCWPPKNHGCFNSFPPLVCILRWKTPFFVETGATCIIVQNSAEFVSHPCRKGLCIFGM